MENHPNHSKPGVWKSNLELGPSSKQNQTGVIVARWGEEVADRGSKVGKRINHSRNCFENEYTTAVSESRWMNGITWKYSSQNVSVWRSLTECNARRQKNRRYRGYKTLAQGRLTRTVLNLTTAETVFKLPRRAPSDKTQCPMGYDMPWQPFR
jgi:hypothetical protein